MLLRVEAVAKRLDCHPTTVRKLIKKGLLGHHRCPGIKVSEEQLQDYLDGSRRTKQERSEPKPCKPKPRRPRLRELKL